MRLLALDLSFFPAAFAEKPKEPVTFDYPDQRLPGIAKATVKGNTRTLHNDFMSFQFDVTEGRAATSPAKRGPLLSSMNRSPWSWTAIATALKLEAQIPEETTPADKRSPRLGDHDAAKSFALTYTAQDDSYRVVWKPILRDGSNYILPDVSITPLRGDLGLNRLVMLHVTAKNLKQLDTTATDVWQFDLKRNHNEWKGMRDLAEKQGTTMGACMSPQGGWGGRHVRFATAKQNNLPYVVRAGQSAKTIWICPANDPYKLNGSTKGGSYGIPNNIFAKAPNSPSQATNKLVNIAKPSCTAAVVDCSLTATTAYKLSSGSDIAAPHNGGCNIAFLDGHVEFFKAPSSYTNGIFKKIGDN